MHGFRRVVVAGPPSVIPAGLAAAIRRHHPESEVSVDDGDVTRGPVEPLGTGWQRLAVAVDPRSWALARGSAMALPHVRDGESVVIVLAGTVMVTGRLDPLDAETGDLVVVARGTVPPPSDDRSPGLAEMLHAGVINPGVVLARPEGATHLEELQRLLTSDPTITAPEALDLVARRHGVTVLDHPSLAVGRWKAPTGPIALVDVDGLDPARPWALSNGPRTERVLLSEHPSLHAAIDGNLDQVPGRGSVLRLPGAIEVDAPLRSVVAANIGHHLAGREPRCPEPFTDVVAFLAWAAGGEPGPGRYWQALLDGRPDLRAAFPEVEVGRYRRFRAWARERWRLEGSSFLVPVDGPDGYEVVDPAHPTEGVNVIGYLDRASGLGEAARELADALESTGVPVARIALGGTASPRLDPASVPPLDQALLHDTNVVVVTAEQFPTLPLQLGTTLTGRRTIGYWFWELSQPSSRAAGSAAMVDEVWTATSFVRDAFDDQVPAPVRLAPLPRPHPEPSARTREGFGLPPDRVVILCSFDFFSVLERKNPEGAIAAFTRAFRPQEGPLLVIKTINGHRRWVESERLRLAAGDRSDIHLWDENLSRGDQLALVRAVDCQLSLHRSEGLGLHLLEAMALGTPVVATGYSGPMDFLDADCAEIVPFELVPVTNGEGAYSESATWAEPDIDAAAAALRRIAGDPAHRTALAAAGRRAVDRIPDRMEAGDALRCLLHQ